MRKTPHTSKLIDARHQKAGRRFIAAFEALLVDKFQLYYHFMSRTNSELAKTFADFDIDTFANLDQPLNILLYDAFEKELKRTGQDQNLETWPCMLIGSAIKTFHEGNYFDAIADLVYSYKYFTLLDTSAELKKLDLNKIYIDEGFDEILFNSMKSYSSRKAANKRTANASTRKKAFDASIKAAAEKRGWGAVGLFGMADELKKLPQFQKDPTKKLLGSLRRLEYPRRKTGKKKTA